MKTIATSALLLLSLCMLSGGPEETEHEVTVTCKNGQAITGFLIGMSDGCYLVEDHDRRRHRIPEASVKDVKLEAIMVKSSSRTADAPAGSGGTASVGLAEVREIERAMREGDYEYAFEIYHRFQESVRRLQYESTQLKDKIHTQYVLSLIRKRDVKGLVSKLKQIDTLEESTRLLILDLVALKIAELVRNEPTGRFTADFAVAVGAHLQSGTPITPERRSQLLTILRRVADEEFRLGEARGYANAAEIYAGLIRIDPETTEDLRGKVKESRFALARILRGDDRLNEAILAIETLLKEEPGNADAILLVGELRFERLQTLVEGALPPRQRELLETYLEAPRKETHAEWAKKRLTEVRLGGAAELRIAKEIETYFPTRKGRRMRYIRTDGRFEELLHVDDIRPFEDALRITYTLTESHKDWSSSHVYEMELSETRVSRLIENTRETLLRFPLQVGDTWSWERGDQTFTRTVISLKEEVTVPLGTFRDCLLVEFETVTREKDGTRRITSKSYYAPGVGLVKLAFDQPSVRAYGLNLVEYGGDEPGIPPQND